MNKMNEYKIYQETILSSIIELSENGYIQGTGGNVSVRIPEKNIIAITPSQKEYNSLKTEDICIIDFDLNPIIDNGFKPSIEAGMHIAIYKNRQDVDAVVHTHQIYASIFSLIDHPIPALFDEVAINIGTTIEIIAYALSGSEELANNVAEKVMSRANCYILQNHGALSLGSDLKNAKQNAELLEKCAKVYYYALTTGKEISPLPDNIQNLAKTLMINKQNKHIEAKDKK